MSRISRKISMTRPRIKRKARIKIHQTLAESYPRKQKEHNFELFEHTRRMGEPNYARHSLDAQRQRYEQAIEEGQDALPNTHVLLLNRPEAQSFYDRLF